MRHFPDVEDHDKPAVHELAISQLSDVSVADVWTGNADLKFFELAVEEVAALTPMEML